MEAQPVSGPRANVQSHVRRAAEWWKESRDPKAELPLREAGPDLRVDERRQVAEVRVESTVARVTDVEVRAANAADEPRIPPREVRDKARRCRTEGGPKEKMIEKSAGDKPLIVVGRFARAVLRARHSGRGVIPACFSPKLVLPTCVCSRTVHPFGVRRAVRAVKRKFFYASILAQRSVLAACLRYELEGFLLNYGSAEDLVPFLETDHVMTFADPSGRVFKRLPTHVAPMRFSRLTTGRAAVIECPVGSQQEPIEP